MGKRRAEKKRVLDEDSKNENRDLDDLRAERENEKE